MVLEYVGIAVVFLNNFFAGHIGFISHTLAALFLIFTEASVNQRIIAPIMDGIENTFFSNIMFIPTMISTMFFIIWAVASLFIYEYVFSWLLGKYQDKLTLILVCIFFFVAWIVNMRYRD